MDKELALISAGKLSAETYEHKLVCCWKDQTVHFDSDPLQHIEPIAMAQSDDLVCNSGLVWISHVAEDGRAVFRIFLWL